MPLSIPSANLLVFRNKVVSHCFLLLCVCVLLFFLVLAVIGGGGGGFCLFVCLFCRCYLFCLSVFVFVYW